MPISVELPVVSALRTPFLSPLALTCAFEVPVSGPRVPATAAAQLKCAARAARRISVMCLVRDSAPLDACERPEAKAGGDSEFVEVVVIGSRKDSIVDFCLDSSFRSVPLRFWCINRNGSEDVQLEQRHIEKDLASKTMSPTQLIQSRPWAIILVATAGYSSDQIEAIDILNTVRAGGGLAVAVLLKPFSFEGRRRLEEVNELAGKLQQHTNFCIDIDIEILLQKDLVTLDEALKNANNAVSMAIHATSALISEVHGKFIDVMHKNLKELKGSEVTKILESYKEAKIGFGAGHNLKTSILRAIYDCPFFRPGIKGLNAIICVVASSVPLQKNDLQTVLLTFRQTIEHAGDIMISTIHEPDLEPKVLVTTFFILSCPEEEASQKGNIFSRLFPFVFDLFKRYRPQFDNERNNRLGEASAATANSSNSNEVDGIPSVKGTLGGFDSYTEEPQGVPESADDDLYASGEASLKMVEPSKNSSDDFHDENIEDHRAFQREPIASWSMDPSYWIEQKRPQKMAADSGDTAVLDSLCIVSLPVGVRPSENLNNSSSITIQRQEMLAKNDSSADSFVNPDGLMKDFNDTGSSLFTDRYADISVKQGNLSARAASMLEAERDSPKRWSPILEMQYRGGLYKGRCQGGLPEGKGRLVLRDGSIYDGMWHHGKRSGLGTFNFKNGDVFQGTWREDVIHGKGWFYFHTGDRWFANFWKGKANGEGRFYSKSGDIFFGHFKDGWRHGRFLCIDVDGRRYSETWDEGVLLSRELVDASADAGV